MKAPVSRQPSRRSAPIACPSYRVGERLQFVPSEVQIPQSVALRDRGGQLDVAVVRKRQSSPCQPALSGCFLGLPSCSADAPLDAIFDQQYHLSREYADVPVTQI